MSQELQPGSETADAGPAFSAETEETAASLPVEEVDESLLALRAAAAFSIAPNGMPVGAQQPAHYLYNL